MRLLHGVTGQGKVVFRSFDLVWDKSKQGHQLSMDVCESCHRIGFGEISKSKQYTIISW